MWPRPGSTQSTLFAGVDCKACDGRGFSLLSTHNWAPFPGDVMPVSELPDEYITPAIVITTEGQQHEMSYPANDANKQAWEEELSGLLSKHADCFVVVADLRR